MSSQESIPSLTTSIKAGEQSAAEPHGSARSTTLKRQPSKYNPQQKKNHPFAKKPRESTFEKKDIPPSLSMVQCKQFYTIFTGSAHLPDIADTVYAALSARVKTLRDVVSRELFQYVVAVSWYARLVAVSIAAGTSLPEGASRLKHATAGIKLPVVLCKYIETIGVYQMSNGAHVLPYCSDYRTLIPIGSDFFCDPLEIIQEARRPDPQTEWSIDTNWITEYNQVAYPKLMRSGVELRTITSDIEGRPELIIGYVDSQDNQITPLSPEKQTLGAARIGAAYRFRDYALRAEWPFGDNDVLSRTFTCEDLSPNLLLANIVSDSLQAN